MRFTKTMMAKVVLLGVLATPILSIPAFGQQEVNPTWYNPWPDAPKPAAKPTATKMAEHARVTHKHHASATQAKKKQAPAQEPLRTAEALPPVNK